MSNDNKRIFLRRYADENNILSRRSLIFESLTHSDSQDDFDIFISHSSLDQKCTLALIELLEKDGIKAYVDFIQDTSMSPNNVTIETAKKIRSRLNQCKSLAYLSTSNTTNSKWCPWELGLSDGLTKGKCAILPVSRNWINSLQLLLKIMFSVIWKRNAILH